MYFVLVACSSCHFKRREVKADILGPGTFHNGDRTQRVRYVKARTENTAPKKTGERSNIL